MAFNELLHLVQLFCLCFLENFFFFFKFPNFSFSIKLGTIEDSANRNRLAKLLRFQTSAHETEMASLADYVERMREKQEHIYYMAGASRKEVCFSFNQ